MESSTASPETDEIVHAEQGEDAVSEDVDKMVQSGSHAHELEKEEDQDVANEVRLLPTLSSSLHLKDIRIHTQDARHGRQRKDGPGRPLRRSDHVTFLQGESSATVNGDTRMSAQLCNPISRVHKRWPASPKHSAMPQDPSLGHLHRKELGSFG